MPQQVEHALGAAAVQLGDASVAADQRQGLGAEVELVVEGDDDTGAEGAQRAGQSRGVDLTVEEVDGPAQDGEDEQAPAPFLGASVGARGAWGAEGGGRGRAVDGLEGSAWSVDGSHEKACWRGRREGARRQETWVPVKASGYVGAEHSRIFYDPGDATAVEMQVASTKSGWLQNFEDPKVVSPDLADSGRANVNDERVGVLVYRRGLARPMEVP